MPADALPPANAPAPAPNATASTTPHSTALDSFDRQILARLQHSTQRKAEHIGSEIGLSASAVQRRIKRLREQGVIQAEVALLDRAQVSRAITLLAGVEIARDNYPALAAFRQWVAAEPAVQQAYYVTGQNDLVLVVLADDMPAYDALCARLMAHIPMVARITTQVVIEPLKLGLNVPIAPVAPGTPVAPG